MKLKSVWASDFRADVHQKMWDVAAGDYMRKPIPRVEENDFLQRMMKVITPESTVLDIGCGAGGYTLALAPYVKQAVGCDLSGNMIGCAKKRTSELEIENVLFSRVNWHAASLAELGWEGKFDVVFAHHTPAVSDYDTFDKMFRCGKKAGFYCVNTRRHDMVLDQILAQIGILPLGDERDKSVPCAFAYLWQKGLEPNIAFRKEIWTSEKSLEKQIDWTFSRAKLRREINAAEVDRIVEYLSALAVDGKISETITTTIVTMDWLM